MLETRMARIRNSLHNEEKHCILRLILQNVSKGLYGMVLAVEKVHREIG